ncbi:hypothetical protein AN189_17650 [Loktanella sp. 3ANDIMAR09]|uniref:hypothetical protein n=1 Tax=Loktanella sp. 3ANDIMAR09 TaxID=1225657 RepID=UPI0006FBCE96|nr:hypothetical protein [Loktanella sp. 3ANDIMAR09]KQI67047.1 hypothetical protein AN189_17650 [Loktanella sp. 3ANDIMAR09]
MDLSNLDTVAAANTGATMTVCHPATGEELKGADGKAMTLTLMGADSGEFKRAVADSMKTNKGRKQSTLADAERATVDLLTRVTIGMSDNWEWDKKPFPFSKENVRRLYDERPWLRQQVDEFIADRSNFLANS